MKKGYTYSRSGNPTVRALENRLTALEGGVDSAAFASGMAAINALFMTFLESGAHVVISDVAYGGTYRLSKLVFTKFGVDVTFADTSDPSQVAAAVRDNTKLILTETPANPTLKLTDVAAVSEIAQSHHIPHAVDNTFLTPYYQQVFELGADLSVHSTTKYLDGHNATVGGAIVMAREEHVEPVRFIQNSTGTIMSPMVAWLTLQGTKTLSERMDRQSSNAVVIARFLEAHPAVAKVAYPGLESFPQQDLASRQASGYGAMLWFELHGGVDEGKTLMNALEVWTLAENLGSVESLATHPVTMTHATVPADERARLGITEGLVRLSVGLEDVADLIEDLERALRKV
jgi:cystathionine beta-lyase/cystathionine gamma-synthase